jgi:hypothetical protein
MGRISHPGSREKLVKRVLVTVMGWAPGEVKVWERPLQTRRVMSMLPGRWYHPKGPTLIRHLSVHHDPRHVHPAQRPAPFHSTDVLHDHILLHFIALVLMVLKAGAAFIIGVGRKEVLCAVCDRLCREAGQAWVKCEPGQLMTRWSGGCRGQAAGCCRCGWRRRTECRG